MWKTFQWVCQSFNIFSTVPLCDVDGCVCLKRGGSSHFFALSCQHSQFLMVKVTAEWYCKNFFRNRYAQQGLINKRLNKVCDSFKMLCSNCLNHWEYLLWEKGLGTKLYDGKSVLKMWKCPYGLKKKHLAKNWKCCFLFIWPSSVALMKVRTSQADVFIEVDHQVQRMGLLAPQVL